MGSWHERAAPKKSHILLSSPTASVSWFQWEIVSRTVFFLSYSHWNEFRSISTRLAFLRNPTPGVTYKSWVVLNEDRRNPKDPKRCVFQVVTCASRRNKSSLSSFFCDSTLQTTTLLERKVIFLSPLHQVTYPQLPSPTNCCSKIRTEPLKEIIH